MNSITYVDPTTESIEEIIWHNLLQADSILNLNLFIASSAAWIKNNPTKNYQDLERELRKRHFNTHLFAKKFEVSNKFTLNAPNDLFEPKYECIYSCRPPKYALSEIMQYWNSYEENFDKLALAGVVSVKSVSDMKQKNSETFVEFSEKQQSDYELVTNCKKLIKITKIQPREYIEQIYKKIQDTLGKPPTNAIVGMTPNGGPIFGFVIDNEIVSNVGFSTEYDSGGNMVFDVVDISKL